MAVKANVFPNCITRHDSVVEILPCFGNAAATATATSDANVSGCSLVALEIGSSLRYELRTVVQVRVSLEQEKATVMCTTDW